jgi:hypothetical protein
MKHYLVAMAVFVLCISGMAQTRKAIRSDGTECPTLPCVIASVTLTDQSTAALRVPIFTPTSDGIFRISSYMTTSDGTVKRAYWELSLGWTDNLATRSALALDVFPNGVAGATQLQSTVAGQPLTYTVKPHGGGGGVGGMTYNLRLILEQLQ